MNKLGGSWRRLIRKKQGLGTSSLYLNNLKTSDHILTTQTTEPLKVAGTRVQTWMKMTAACLILGRNRFYRVLGPFLMDNGKLTLETGQAVRRREMGGRRY